MYELKGVEYSLEQLQDTAKKYDMDFDSYLEIMKTKYGLVEKTSDVATQGAPVTSANDMASSSEDTYLQLTFDDTKNKHNWLTSSIKDVKTGKTINQPDYSFFDNSDDDAVPVLKEASV